MRGVAAGFHPKRVGAHLIPLQSAFGLQTHDYVSSCFSEMKTRSRTAAVCGLDWTLGSVLYAYVQYKNTP